MRRAFAVSTICLCVITMLFATGTSGSMVMRTPTVNSVTSTSGVFGDSTAPFQQGVGGVQSYFGAGGKNYDLVTYGSGRTFHFVAYSSQAAIWTAAKLPTNFNGEVDFYGVNYYGLYTSMAAGTTAQVHGVVQFHYGKTTTYQLDYQSLAVKRDATTGVYHFTSDPNDIGGYPGFTASSQAQLGQVRKSGNIYYGAVNAPIKFDVTMY